MAITDPKNDVEQREEVQKALGQAHQSGCYLEKLHIFVLAHAMRRPIVVYHFDSNQPRGSLMSGIYLPDLWGELGERDGCSRVPLCLVFTGMAGMATGQGHFTACVGAEGYALMLPLSDHVHGERLLIRFGPDLVDTPSAGPTDSWAAHAALHLELTWSAASDSGDLYDEEAKPVAPARVRSFPFAYVSRTPADSGLMLRSVAELRDQFVAEVTRSAVELRIAPDGVAYTKNQFVHLYGGTLEWDQAAPLGSTMPTTAPPSPPRDTAPLLQLKSPKDLQGLLKGAISMEDLDSIAQNIIRLKLTHSERVQQARDHFHEQCAKFGGVDDATFSVFFEVCDEALRHADDGACAGGAASAPLPMPDDSPTEQSMVPKVMRQSTIATEMETLWTANLIQLFVEELNPIYSGSSQSEGSAIKCAAEAEIQQLKYSAAQSGVFGTPDAMAVVRTL